MSGEAILELVGKCSTSYFLDQRFRGGDVREVGPDEVVDLVSEWTGPDGRIEERRAERFRIVPYRTPRGNAAAYYPETNVLVPLDSVADVSGTPTSKSVVVRLEHRDR